MSKFAQDPKSSKVAGQDTGVNNQSLLAREGKNFDLSQGDRQVFLYGTEDPLAAGKTPMINSSNNQNEAMTTSLLHDDDHAK